MGTHLTAIFLLDAIADTDVLRPEGYTASIAPPTPYARPAYVPSDPGKFDHSPYSPVSCSDQVIPRKQSK